MINDCSQPMWTVVPTPYPHGTPKNIWADHPQAAVEKYLDKYGDELVKRGDGTPLATHFYVFPPKVSTKWGFTKTEVTKTEWEVGQSI